MAKNLSVWYRRFIVFAVLWTLGSVTLFYVFSPFPKEIKVHREKLRDINFLLAELMSEKEKEGLGYSDIERDPKRQIEIPYRLRMARDPRLRMELVRKRRIERDRKRRIEGDYKQRIYEYHKNRKSVIYLFPLYWLVPVGFVYGIGWCVGWIRRGFRKDKE